MSLDEMIYIARQEAREEAAQNLARNLRISVEEARKLLVSRAGTAADLVLTPDDDMAPRHSTSSAAEVSTAPGVDTGIRRMNLGANSEYIGGIHTGDMRMDIANRLRWLRNHSGMLRDVILNNFGVSKETLDKIEGGQQEPTDTQLIILADLYGVKVADIMKQ